MIRHLIYYYNSKMSTPEERLRNAMKKEMSSSRSTPEDALRASMRREMRHARAEEAEREGNRVFNSGRNGMGSGMGINTGLNPTSGIPVSGTPVYINTPTGMMAINPGATMIPVAGGGVAIINGSTYGVPNQVQFLGQNPGQHPGQTFRPGFFSYR